MATLNSYDAVAHAYADGVRALFASSGLPTKERGAMRGPSSYRELAERAEKLSSISEDFTKVIASQLDDADPAVRTEASTRMLAKTLTDLEVGAQLLQAAMDEEEKAHFGKSRSAERGRADVRISTEYLKILLGEGKTFRRGVERGGGPANIAEARSILSTTMEDALALISDRANKAAQTAVGGLIAIGVEELAKAAGALGMGLAELLGQAEKVSRLYNLFRGFVGKVYDALAALVGESLMQNVGQRVLEWVNELKGGTHFSQILETLYQTKLTEKELKTYVDESKASLEKFSSVIQDVDGLKDGYGIQVKLAEKLLNGLNFLGGLSEAILPQGKLIFAACYMALGGYVVIAGADYVDSPRLRWLDRVAGIRRTVEENL